MFFNRSKDSDHVELLKRIKSLKPWHYQYTINDIHIGIDNKKKIVRHQQRKKYFFDPLVKHFGGSLKGKRILDLGCNSGFWALQCIKAGADSVIGVDGRELHIDQANLIFELENIPSDKYQFIHEDVYKLDFAALGHFDIVLNLGLFYHINKPLVLLEKIAQINTDILITDTVISKMKGGFFELKIENVQMLRQGLEKIAMFPTPRALIEMLKVLGYSTIMLKPEFENWLGSKDYELGQRNCFISSKVTDLRDFPAREQQVDNSPIFGESNYKSPF